MHFDAIKGLGYLRKHLSFIFIRTKNDECLTKRAHFHFISLEHLKKKEDMSINSIGTLCFGGHKKHLPVWIASCLGYGEYIYIVIANISYMIILILV